MRKRLPRAGETLAPAPTLSFRRPLGRRRREGARRPAALAASPSLSVCVSQYVFIHAHAHAHTHTYMCVCAAKGEMAKGMRTDLQTDTKASQPDSPHLARLPAHESHASAATGRRTSENRRPSPASRPSAHERRSRGGRLSLVGAVVHENTVGFKPSAVFTWRLAYRAS